MITGEELKERYKILPVWARLAVALVIGLIPGIYLYSDEGDALNQKLVESTENVQAARRKFEEARKKKSNLPQLEEQMAYTEDQLAKAKLKLPDHVVIEDILQKAATIAKQTGVQLSTFNPAPDIPHTQPYQYVEAPIATEIVGRFAQVATFFDQMIHLDGTVFMRHIELVRQENDDKARVGQSAEADKKSPYETAQNARHNLQVRARFDIVVYRSFNERERMSGVGASPAPAPGAKKPAASPAPTEAVPGGPAAAPPA